MRMESVKYLFSLRVLFEENTEIREAIGKAYRKTYENGADIHSAKKFYIDLFGLEVYQDYGRNIMFTCGLALQQDFDWLVNPLKEKIKKIQ